MRQGRAAGVGSGGQGRLSETAATARTHPSTTARASSNRSCKASHPFDQGVRPTDVLRRLPWCVSTPVRRGFQGNRPTSAEAASSRGPRMASRYSAGGRSGSSRGVARPPEDQQASTPRLRNLACGASQARALRPLPIVRRGGSCWRLSSEVVTFMCAD